MIKESLAQTEKEGEHMDKVKVEVEDKMTILEKSIMQLHTKTKAIRDDILNHASQQKTIEKSSANLIKQTKNGYEKIAGKEVEIEDISNEISRVQIDNLNTQSQNELLQSKLKDLIVELKTKESDVTKEEASIKERHVDISKKQHKVDRLNRQYADLTHNGDSGENNGPLENQQKGLKKQIIETDDETQ